MKLNRMAAEIGTTSALIAMCLGASPASEAVSVQGRAYQVANDRNVIHLLSRASYGARPEDITRVNELGIEGWLDWQLAPNQIEDSAWDEAVQRFPAAFMTSTELLDRYLTGQEIQQIQREMQSGEMSEEERRSAQADLRARNPRRVLADLNGARFHLAANSERQLQEVMTAFWFDHFNVFFGKNGTRWLVSDYEQVAIRPHVFGTFEEMLIATASHPAMLYYLDNWRSAAPDTAAIRRDAEERLARLERGVDAARSSRSSIDGRNRMGTTNRPTLENARERLRDAEAALEMRMERLPGLNENYARELLELHTLGVDGGYSQDDVINLARIFTGWTLVPERRAMQAGPAQRPNQQNPRPRMSQGEMRQSAGSLPANAEPYSFWYREELHDQGEKTLLGRTFPASKFPASGGQNEAIEAIRMLAHHPSTARHIATQLATRFVSDTPPESLIDDLAEVFLETDGDLSALTRALFLSDEFYDSTVYGTRTKSPLTLVGSALRMTGAEVRNPAPLMEVMEGLGQPLYMSDVPTGYPETSEQWASSGAMVSRFNFASELSRGELRGVIPDGALLLRDAQAESSDVIEGLVSVLLPVAEDNGTQRGELIELIRSEIQGLGENATDRAQGSLAVGLILGSPDFQRH